MTLSLSVVLALLNLILQCSASQAILTPPSHHQSITSLIPNAIARAPDIFNALHGAMRQWGASLKHNGMSYFPVTIPENIRLYHGAPTSDPHTGLGWLSFEIEHATLFAKVDLWFPPNERSPEEGPNQPIQKYNGSIHNYRTIRPLTNLLYLDGQSSAKSRMGTLDSQDRVLIKHTNFTERPGFRDTNRGQALCELSPHIDGFVRMELGFEIILCNFTSSVEFLDVTAVEPQPNGNTRDDLISETEYIRGITHRYGGIGAGRVIVDYSSMVSAFFYPLNLTNPDPKHPDLPRIDPDDDETTEQIKSDVLAALNNRERWQHSINWQGVVDLIVSRYSDRLAYMTKAEMGPHDMLSELKFLLEHFIDFSHVNLTTARWNCARHYLVPEETLVTTSDQLINQAILTTSEKICDVLFDVRDSLLGDDGVRNTFMAKLLITKLMDWLKWDTWLECGKCELNEVCFVPMWPFGRTEDHIRPQCISTMVAFSRFGYWDYGS